ncbi:hypothetical protein K493DRAFT_290848 [Basidiobolus meristosporus CBS 931.73]|uniref:Uncharacterized protein n=1 Tax=Basidiobolus meristosporus CBS 931.73 TaxID=1314790 RepID=A0A1Y1XQL0_9FUNG|nr:hypothetical protein K493DRAFT_290848 [Basidiobolus meristosporus CBS 931.73]|eukprot:ORX88059.1 hypothetical protein K493DRAFT_290848 [Basidiobolus meristosporus CBS 931.73]
MNQTSEINLLSYFEKMLFEPLVDFTKLISSKDMPVETDWSSGYAGSWFISPRQHTIEFLSYLSIFTLAATYFYKRGFKNAKANRIDVPSYPRSLCEKLVITVLSFSLVLVAAHKYMTDSTIFLLQPCHVSLVILLTVLICPKTWRLPHVLFNVYLNIMWGTILALLFPDYRSYTLFLEVENFILEHWLILLTPLYIFYTRKVAVWKPSVSMTLASHCFYALYNVVILLPFALVSGQNLNYQLSPPVQLLPVFGKFYRLGMHLLCLPLTFLMRWLLVSVAFKLIPRKAIPSSSKKTH